MTYEKATDLDVMFCWGYGSADDPVRCMESDGQKEPGRAGQKELIYLITLYC